MKRLKEKVALLQKSALQTTLTWTIDLIRKSYNIKGKKEIVFNLEKPIYVMRFDNRGKELNQSIFPAYSVSYRPQSEIHANDLFLLDYDGCVITSVTATSATMAHIVFNSVCEVISNNLKMLGE